MICMEQLRELCREWLAASGFREAQRWEGNFYKEDTQYTAFFANFKDRKDCVGICFGLASTAFTRMAGSEDSLNRHGILNEMGCLRQFVFVREEKDILTLQEKLNDLMEEYAGLEKDGLLKLLKDRRKEFIGSIHAVLKPAGFKKKGNEWSMQLSDHHILRFLVDKSSFCDSYRFIILIKAQNKLVESHLYCINQTLELPGMDRFDPGAVFPFDWQLNNREELMKVLEMLIRDYVEPVKRGGIEELGKLKHIRKSCKCDRDCCEKCWVKKGILF